MFVCSKIDKKIIINPNNFIFMKPNNKKKILVIIDENNIKKSLFCKKSTKNNLLNSTKHLTVDIEILNYDDIKIISYNIDTILTNQIYIKLEPTNMYLIPNNYIIKNFLLKNNELIKILTILGAKKIISKTNFPINNINFNFEIELDDIVLEKYDNFYNDNNNNFSKEMYFDYNQNIELLNYDSFNNNEYFYLPTEYEWQDIIIRRLENNCNFDKYTLNNTNDLIFNKIKSKLQYSNIKFSYNNNLFNTKTEYEIEYYPLNNNNFQKNIFKKNDNKTVVDLDNDTIQQVNNDIIDSSSNNSNDIPIEPFNDVDSFGIVIENN
jgi:hypothetical protein